MIETVTDASSGEAGKILEKIGKLNELYGMSGNEMSWVNTSIFQNIFNQAKSSNRPLEVADLFCGSGNGSIPTINNAINNDFPIKVHLVDKYEPMIDSARQVIESHRSDLIIPEYSVRDLSDGILPFEDNSLDVVTLYRALHELPLEVQKKVIEESKRVLRKDGMLVILGNQLNGPTIGDKNLASMFTDIIRTKDILGQVSSRRDTHFSSRNELKGMLGNADFQAVIEGNQWMRRWSTVERAFEFSYDPQLLNIFNNHVYNHLNNFIDLISHSSKLTEKYKHDFITQLNLRSEQITIERLKELYPGIDVSTANKLVGMYDISFDVNSGFIIAQK